MRTEDITEESHAGEWRRERSERVNALLGKMAEEAAELASRCARAMIQGLYAKDPGDGRSNLEHLEDEMADVAAQMHMFSDNVSLDNRGLRSRMLRKIAFKAPWIAALPD